MTLKLFVTGTDTDIGKTYVSKGLLRAFNQAGYSTIGIKPLASGAVRKNGVLYNEDALGLQAVSSIKLDYSLINPVVFEPPIAPHIAAKRINEEVTVARLCAGVQPALNHPADVHLLEGIGGWYVFLNERETMVDFVKACQLKVVLVAGIRLGCFNHVVMTYEAIKKAGLPVLGWIANVFAPMPEAPDVIESLKQWLPTPCLGVVNYRELPEEALAKTLFTSPLVGEVDAVGGG